jgi:protein gp37
MADKTSISWTDATWNPVRGCSRVSEGCRNCYAEVVAGRFCDPGQPYEGVARRTRVTINGLNTTRGRWTGEVRMVPERLADPLRWKRARRIFVNSMSDLFHEGLTNEQIAAVFGVMAAAPQHTFQVLTKRAKRMREWFEWIAARPTALITIPFSPRLVCRYEAGLILDPDATNHALGTESQPRQWPLPNVWLGVSVENQAAADERIPELLHTPASVRFLSCEPLIGPVNISVARPSALSPDPLDRISWVIAGCESGPGARPCSVEWLRSLRDQCASAGVAFFLKQARDRPPVRGVCTSDGPVTVGPGSNRKGAGVIELPYLDGVQHAAFPAVRR